MWRSRERVVVFSLRCKDKHPMLMPILERGMSLSMALRGVPCKMCLALGLR